MLCPLTEAEAERAAVWTEAWDAKSKSNTTSREEWPPPKVQANEYEGKLALLYVREKLGEHLEAFIEMGERPRSLSSMGDSSFTEPADPLVGYDLECRGWWCPAGFWRPVRSARVTYRAGWRGCSSSTSTAPCEKASTRVLLSSSRDEGRTCNSW